MDGCFVLIRFRAAHQHSLLKGGKGDSREARQASATHLGGHHHEHFIDRCLCVGFSFLCGIHSADEAQPGRNSCLEFAFLILAFNLSSIMSLSR